MNNTEKQSIERRSEFSQLMRQAQQLKKEGDWATVKQLQNQMTVLLNKISSEA